MSKMICRVSIVLTLLFVSSAYPQLVHAQAAKTIFAQVSGQVLDLNGNPIADAVVQLEGPISIKTTSDASGHFVFANVAPGTYTIVTSAHSYDIVSRNGIAVQNEDVSLDIRLATTSTLKEIGHVSTTSGRSAINVTAAPTYSLTPQDMAFQGQTQWKKVLEEIPGVSVTDFIGGIGSVIPGAPSNGQVVSIRGALPYETALLIDNMPMYGIGNNTQPGQGVDLSTYNPQTFNAFDVIEGPGAQSPSIVDSIGGSLNLHPAGQVTQNQYAFSVSDDAYGGWIANGVFAMRMGKLSATATYGLNNSQGPIPLGEPQSFGGPSTLFNYVINTVNGVPFTCGTSCGTLLYPHGATGFLNSGQTSGIVGCCIPATNRGWIDHSESLSLFYQPSSSAIAQFFFANNTQVVGYTDDNIPTIFTPPAGYVGSLPAGSSVLIPGCFGSFAQGTDDQESQMYEGKMTFQLGHGQLQLAALTNTSWARPTTNNITSLGIVHLFGGGAYYTNPGVNGNTTPAIFNGGLYAVSLFPNNSVQDRIAHNRDLSASYATPLSENSRATVSFVHSYYDDALYFNNLIGFSDSIGGTITCDFISVNPPINEQTDEIRLGYGLTPNHRTSFDLSAYLVNARYHLLNPNDPAQATYIDQGFHYNAPRASFVWRPNYSLAIRASMGGGFALAPAEYMSGTNGAVTCLSGICSQSLENVNLQPESSWGYDVGFDQRFAQSTIFSFDIYDTNLHGQLYRDTETNGTCSVCGGLPLFTTQYRNLGQTRYQGIALNVHRDVPHGVIWSLSGSLMRGYIVSLPSGFYNASNGICNFTTGVDCANARVVPNINFNGLFTLANVPYAQGFATYGYRWSPNRFVAMDIHYFGNNNGYYAPAFVVLDANAQMPLTKRVALQGTFRNITGQLDSVLASFGNGGYIYPTAFGPSAYAETIPYGPRTFLLTLSIH